MTKIFQEMTLTNCLNIFNLPTLIASVRFWGSPKPLPLLIPPVNLTFGVPETIVSVNYSLEVLTGLRKAFILMVMVDCSTGSGTFREGCT